MNFQRLTSFAARTTARLLGTTSAGRINYAWLPASATTRAQVLADYTLSAGPAMTGAARIQPGVAMGLAVQPDDIIAITLDGHPLTYDPTPGITTILVGRTKALALRYAITAFRRSAGVVELEAKKLTALAA